MTLAGDQAGCVAQIKWLYRLGGAAALFGAVMIPIQAVVFVAFGQPDSARGRFD